MSFNPVLQLNIRHFFNRLGMFELLQFDVRHFNTAISLDTLIVKMKQSRFFECSFAFSKFTDDAETAFEPGEFGNYNFQKITGYDYTAISTHELMPKLSFEDKGDQLWLSMKEINDIVSKNLNQYISPAEFFFELTIAPGQKEKLASYCFWDNFKNFIGIDNEKKIIHLITTGAD